MKPIQCELCNIETPRTNSNQKYCADCYCIMNNILCGYYGWKRRRIAGIYCTLCRKPLTKLRAIYCKDCFKKHRKKYNTYYNNRGKMKTQRKKYDKKYKESERGRKNNLGWNRKRRAMRHNIIHNFTDVQWNKKIESCGGICPICDKK